MPIIKIVVVQTTETRRSILTDNTIIDERVAHDATIGDEEKSGGNAHLARSLVVAFDTVGGTLLALLVGVQVV